MLKKTLVETRRRISDQEKRRLSWVINLASCAIIAALISVILLAEYLQFRNNFQKSAVALDNHVQRLFRENEAVLEGFAAFLSQKDELDDKSAVAFTKKLRQRFPHIYMMEVAEGVRSEDLERLIERQQKKEYPDYKVKAFDYSGGRDWRHLPDKKRYYPLIFLSPLPEESRVVLGLDLGSHPFLNDPMQQALNTNHYQSSLPFQLIEGGDAFVMFLPVDGPVDTTIQAKPVFIVLIVLLIDRLFADIKPYLGDIGDILIYHSDRGRADPVGHLFKQNTPNRLHLFRTSYDVELEPRRNGYVLSLNQFFYVADIPWMLISIVILITSSIFLYTRSIIIRRYHRDMEWAWNEARLQLLASYDALTDLPNRRFLVESLELNLKEAGGQLKLALLYLDLDSFKDINDQHGHRTGDTILQETARRIRNTIRKEDMAARLGGDEFVVVLQNYVSSESVYQFIKKLRMEIRAPYYVEGHATRIDVSVGVAFYPDDTADLMKLLHIADKSMYADKRRRGARPSRREERE